MKNKADERKPLDKGVEASILLKSRRRCCLCFGLKGDISEKHGQIAHLDQKRTNSNEDNLAWLCLEHHTIYDSTNSQHKNYTLEEIKNYRNLLYEAILDNRHLQRESHGGKGGDAKVVGDHGVAIGGDGGADGLGGPGGPGGDATVEGFKGRAVGGRGGDAGKEKWQGGKGGRSALEALGIPNVLLPDGTWLWDRGKGGDGADIPPEFREEDNS